MPNPWPPRLTPDEPVARFFARHITPTASGRISPATSELRRLIRMVSLLLFNVSSDEHEQAMRAILSQEQLCTRGCAATASAWRGTIMRGNATASCGLRAPGCTIPEWMTLFPNTARLMQDLSRLDTGGLVFLPVPWFNLPGLPTESPINWPADDPSNARSGTDPSPIRCSTCAQLAKVMASLDPGFRYLSYGKQTTPTLVQLACFKFCKVRLENTELITVQLEDRLRPLLADYSPGKLAALAELAGQAGVRAPTGRFATKNGQLWPAEDGVLHIASPELHETLYARHPPPWPTLEELPAALDASHAFWSSNTYMYGGAGATKHRAAGFSHRPKTAAFQGACSSFLRKTLPAALQLASASSTIGWAPAAGDLSGVYPCRDPSTFWEYFDPTAFKETMHGANWYLAMGGYYPQTYHVFESIQAGTCPLQVYMPDLTGDKAKDSTVTARQFAAEQPYASTLGLDYFKMGDVVAVNEAPGASHGLRCLRMAGAPLSKASAKHARASGHKYDAEATCLQFMEQRIRQTIGNRTKSRQCLSYVQWARPLFTAEGIYQYLLLLMATLGPAALPNAVSTTSAPGTATAPGTASAPSTSSTASTVPSRSTVSPLSVDASQAPPAGDWWFAIARLAESESQLAARVEGLEARLSSLEEENRALLVGPVQGLEARLSSLEEENRSLRNVRDIARKVGQRPGHAPSHAIGAGG